MPFAAEMKYLPGRNCEPRAEIGSGCVGGGAWGQSLGMESLFGAGYRRVVGTCAVLIVDAPPWRLEKA